jgi:hypothetical protein
LLLLVVAVAVKLTAVSLLAVAVVLVDTEIATEHQAVTRLLNRLSVLSLVQITQ